MNRIAENEVEVNQFSNPFLVVGYCVIEKISGEIVLDLDNDWLEPGLINKIRTDIDWDCSLDNLLLTMPFESAVCALMRVYEIIYMDYPDFMPGFANRRFVKSPDGSPDNRGLSNSNKVQNVVLKNSETGEEIVLEKKAARLSKMRKRVFSWANTIKDYLPAHGIGLNHRKVMITLTYEKVEDWRPNHIRDYVKELKRRLGEKAIALAWVAELQERGAVHYHLELICVKGTRIPMPDKSGMWIYGMSKIETAKSIFYICSYLKKDYQKMGEFPKGIRIFSVWVAKEAVTTIARWFMRLSTLPTWFANKIMTFEDHQGEAWERMKGGGYLFAGKFFRSPFRFLGFA